MFVKLLMQQDFITVEQDTSLAEADEILKHNKFRHLPVVEADELVGIITQTDIQKALPSAIDSSLNPHDRILASQAKVSSFMTTAPVTVSQMDPLENVARLMRKFKIGAIPVLEEKVVGIITESDIFQAFIEMLDGDGEGARIEVQTGHDKSAIYTVIDTCKRFEMELTAIAVYRNLGPEQQLLTFRVTGKNLEQMVDALWKDGAKVKRILMNPEDE